MLSPRLIATEGLGGSPRLVAVRGLWPGEEAWAGPPGTIVKTLAPGKRPRPRDEDEALLLLLMR